MNFGSYFSQSRHKIRGPKKWCLFLQLAAEKKTAFVVQLENISALLIL